MHQRNSTRRASRAHRGKHAVSRACPAGWPKSGRTSDTYGCKVSSRMRVWWRNTRSPSWVR